jgi:hypothetical protein
MKISATLTSEPAELLYRQTDARGLPLRQVLFQAYSWRLFALFQQSVDADHVRTENPNFQ